MPVYIKPVMFTIHCPGRYGPSGITVGKCDKCSHDSGSDEVIGYHAFDVMEFIHICGHCGNRTTLAKFAIQEMLCQPIIPPEPTLLASVDRPATT